MSSARGIHLLLHIRILIGITLTFVVVVIVLLAVIGKSYPQDTSRQNLGGVTQSISWFSWNLFGSDELFSEQDPKRLFDPLTFETLSIRRS